MWQINAFTIGLVALGGALGSISRLLLSHQISLWLGREFAWGTLGVNVLGSFLIGLLSVFLVEKWMLGIEWRMFFIVGFLGAFTTFSTFSFETYHFIQLQEYSKAIANMALSLVLTVLAVWGGLMLGKQWLTH